jgi:hypothetical protein
MDPLLGKERPPKIRFRAVKAREPLGIFARMGRLQAFRPIDAREE